MNNEKIIEVIQNIDKNLAVVIHRLDEQKEELQRQRCEDAKLHKRITDNQEKITVSLDGMRRVMYWGPAALALSVAAWFLARHFEKII